VFRCLNPDCMRESCRYVGWLLIPRDLNLLFCLEFLCLNLSTLLCENILRILH
jgi:hypothetical protein